MPKMTRFCARNAGLCAVLRRIATVGLASIFSFKHLIINSLSTYSGRKMHRERGILWDWGVGVLEFRFLFSLFFTLSLTIVRQWTVMMCKVW
jgi:hypothetical protein